MPKAVVIRHYRPVTFACLFKPEQSPPFPHVTFGRLFPTGTVLCFRLPRLYFKFITQTLPQSNHQLILTELVWFPSLMVRSAEGPRLDISWRRFLAGRRGSMWMFKYVVRQYWVSSFLAPSTRLQSIHLQNDTSMLRILSPSKTKPHWDSFATRWMSPCLGQLEA